MAGIKLAYVRACFECICWMAVLSMVSYWIYIYALNEDLCLVDYKTYFESESDEPPMLSICLKDPISEIKLKRHAPQIDLNTYLGILNGSHYNVS